MPRTVTIPTLLLGLVLLSARGADAIPLGSETAAEAFSLCQQAERTDGETRRVLLDHGLVLAETAVAADATDARAQFALFCNLGRRVQAAGLVLAHPSTSDGLCAPSTARPSSPRRIRTWRPPRGRCS